MDRVGSGRAMLGSGDRTPAETTTTPQGHRGAVVLGGVAPGGAGQLGVAAGSVVVVSVAVVGVDPALAAARRRAALRRRRS